MIKDLTNIMLPSLLNLSLGLSRQEGYCNFKVYVDTLFNYDKSNQLSKLKIQLRELIDETLGVEGSIIDDIINEFLIRLRLWRS